MTQAGQVDARTTIIMPARLAADDVDGGLSALLDSTTDRAVDVHVVCNGPADDTDQRVGSWAASFIRRGWTVTAHQTDVSGKPAALRFGSTHRGAGGVMVLDSRVRIHPPALEALIAATENSEVGVVSAQLNYVASGGWVSQAFCRAYGASPYARSDDLKGTCVYFAPEFADVLASIPDLASDDRYFVSAVKRSQRASIAEAKVDYVFPSGARDLVRQQIRWVHSNVEVDRAAGDYERNAHEAQRRPYFGASRPSLFDRIVYFGVVAISRVIARTRRPLDGAW